MEDLQQIAEDYVYRNRRLTKEERNALKESRYADLIKDEATPEFDRILEFHSKEEIADAFDIPKPKYTVSRFHPGVEAGIIKDLITALKKRYDLGVDNWDIHQFDRPDYSEVKSFIVNDFIPRHTEEGSATRKAIMKACNADNLEDCWHALCYAGHHIRRPVY